MTKTTIQGGSNLLSNIPASLLAPNDWAADAQKRAVDYLGCPESQWFVMEARRYLALAERIRCLEKELNENFKK